MAKKTGRRERTTEADREIVKTLSNIALISFEIGGDYFNLPKSLETLSSFYKRNLNFTLSMDDSDWHKFNWKDYSVESIDSLTKATAILVEQVLSFASLINDFRVGNGKSRANFIALATEINRRKENKP